MAFFLVTRIAELEAALLPLARQHVKFPNAMDDATMINTHDGIADDDLTFGHARHAAELLGLAITIGGGNGNAGNNPGAAGQVARGEPCP